jgi:bis(5'-nucleosyl)-tetraphosphatase (symmetrical)
VGDLVNRGPESLACLRYVKSLGEAAVAVLGNHDLHLVCVAEGVEKPRKRDTLEGILEAPDRDELLAWLRFRPLMHVENGFALVHAGLLPEWTVARAAELAREVENRLRARDYRAFLEKMYGDKPDRWDEKLTGVDRLRVIVNAMTRLRVCTVDGRMALEFKGEPDETRGAMIPWFDMPRRRSAGHTIVVGHWSALGLLERSDIFALDTGCVWGRSLSAVRLEDRKIFQASCG